MLYDADILDRQKKGKMVYYFIKDDDLKKILAQLDRWIDLSASLKKKK